MTPVRSESIGILNRSTVHGVQCTLLFFYSNPHSPVTQSHLTEIKSLRRSSFIELSLCVKSQKFHSEFQAAKIEVEHSIFAIAAMFV